MGGQHGSSTARRPRRASVAVALQLLSTHSRAATEEPPTGGEGPAGAKAATEHGGAAAAVVAVVVSARWCVAPPSWLTPWAPCRPSLSAAALDGFFMI